MSAAVGPVRWGILGTGRINRKLLEGARQSGQLEVVAVASRGPDRAAAFASEHAIPRAHGSYEALLDDPGVEAVYISLPNSLHHPWTMRALAAGKHVLCEKPYTRRSAEVVEAFDAAERAGLVLSEAFMWRHTPQVGRLLELLPRIGPLEQVRATFCYRLDDATDIRLLPVLDGGSLMDVGCYCVSGARLLAAREPERVWGEQVVGPSGVDVAFAATLRFPGGLLASLSCSFGSHHMGLEAIGREGTILLPDPWHSVTGLVILDGDEALVEPTNPYRLELENLGAAIRGRADPLLGRADALGQARTIEALYRSAETGTAVDPGSLGTTAP
ncbi:MAG TPA: Gfo/Idh/MocA family oxidoreductase [Candidatus Limnocylindrales bacterium]|nr:Gfo/Idh/MocA family oxidoreductase [Candidatus Limnocylindrales bacterium]